MTKHSPQHCEDSWILCFINVCKEKTKMFKGAHHFKQFLPDVSTYPKASCCKKTRFTAVHCKISPVGVGTVQIIPPVSERGECNNDP